MVQKMLNVVCIFIDLTLPSPILRCEPGARFPKNVLSAIQIRWKLRLALIPLLAIGSQQSVAHATTAQLSCRERNFVAITISQSMLERNEISIELDMRWKNVSETGPWAFQVS